MANNTIVCPICGLSVDLTNAASALGLRAEEVSPSHPEHIRRAVLDLFVAPHWVARWDPRFKFLCPMSNAKAKAV